MRLSYVSLESINLSCQTELNGYIDPVSAIGRYVSGEHHPHVLPEISVYRADRKGQYATCHDVSRSTLMSPPVGSL